MLDEYIIEPSTLPGAQYFIEDENDMEEEGIRIYLDGGDGGPNAVVCRHSPGARGERHFHHGSQFQFTLEGSVDFPRDHIDALGVFYTDHNTLYGPFTMNDNHRMLVVWPRPSGQMWATEKGVRELRNREGRQLYRSSKDVEWEKVEGQTGVRRKLLIPDSAGPSAQIVELEAGAEVNLGATAYGRVEFVLDGTASVGGKDIEKETLRFCRGDRDFDQIKAGPNGATVVVLSFDADAAKGEMGGLSMADRMASFRKVEVEDLQSLKV